MKGLIKLVAAGSMVALLAGCGAITSQMSKPKGGLAGMEIPATAFTKSYEANSPQIYGGDERYASYIAAKDKAAYDEALGRGTLDLFGDSAGPAFLKSAAGGGNPSFDIVPYTGSNVVKVSHEVDGTIAVTVTESGSDVSVDSLASDYKHFFKDRQRGRSAQNHPDRYFRQKQIFVSYFSLGSNGVLAGETFSPMFIGGSHPIWVYFGKMDTKTPDAGIADYINTLILNQRKPELVTAALKNQNFCNVGTSGYFCKLSADDRGVLLNSFMGDYPTAKANLAKLDVSLFADIAADDNKKDAGGVDATGKPAKKKLSW